jgi:septal ring factor EnvC (AmiA/AmiB activator)
MRRRMDRSRLRAFAFLVAVVAAVCVAVPAGGQQSEGGLRNKIDSQRSQERSLSSSVARLGKLERATAREVAILEKRVAAVQSDLVAAETKLASTEERRNRQRERALRLRARLKQSRAQLATVLRHRYTGGRPDIVTVVLRADGFAQTRIAGSSR